MKVEVSVQVSPAIVLASDVGAGNTFVRSVELATAAQSDHHYDGVWLMTDRPQEGSNLFCVRLNDGVSITVNYQTQVTLSPYKAVPL